MVDKPKRKTLEERLAESKSAPETELKSKLQEAHPDIEIVDVQTNVADDPAQESAYQDAYVKERTLQVASFILQGIYANSGVPRRVQEANTKSFEYLTGEAMDKAMRQRAEFAIKQAKITMDLL